MHIRWCEWPQCQTGKLQLLAHLMLHKRCLRYLISIETTHVLQSKFQSCFFCQVSVLANKEHGPNGLWRNILYPWNWKKYQYKFNRALIVSLIVITGRKLHTETPQQFHFITADNIILECRLFYILANF